MFAVIGGLVTCGVVILEDGSAVHADAHKTSLGGITVANGLVDFAGTGSIAIDQQVSLTPNAGSGLTAGITGEPSQTLEIGAAGLVLGAGLINDNDLFDPQIPSYYGQLSGTLDFTDLGTLEASGGTLTITDGASFTTANVLTDDGTVIVTDGSALTVGGWHHGLCRRQPHQGRHHRRRRYRQRNVHRDRRRRRRSRARWFHHHRRHPARR